MSRGYTLPVWVTAAASAALAALRGEPFAARRSLDLLDPAGRAELPVRAAALLGEDTALGEAICDPGEGLDLTHGLVVWALLHWQQAAEAGRDGVPDLLVLEAGEGVGRHSATGDPCASAYARRLLAANLLPALPPDRRLRLRVVLPGGRELAERTSNAAFGVVEGLALIGTRAMAQGSAGPDRLQQALDDLGERTRQPGFGGDLVIVIGANGLDLARRLGIPGKLLLQAGNWLGPVLVAAAAAGVRRLLLFGYQGKLLKLAGGIFHTHHHLADGRAEVLTALAALEGLGGEALAGLYAAGTVEAALQDLAAMDPAMAGRLRQRVAEAVEERSVAYLCRHGEKDMEVGAVLFDRSRRICARGPLGASLLERFVGAT